MKSGSRWMLIAGFALSVMLCASSPSSADGKAVFLAAKCNNCHTVKSQGIPKKGENEEKTTDLSKTGATRTAAWTTKYLNLQETINGKKHKKKFSGSPADLAELVKWLGTLK